MTAPQPVEALALVSLTTADLDAAERFYVGVLGFRSLGRRRLADWDAWRLLLDGPGSGATVLTLRLGEQRIAFVCFDAPGEAYPADSTATDLWFQHLALVVSDIGAARERVLAGGAMPISVHGPEHLPPSTGSVDAFKFRDPEGHPLELLHLPPGVGDPLWQVDRRRLFLGIDHSAIAVSDAERSRIFYEGLGLTTGTATLNRGPAQDRLDAVAGDRVDVVPLTPPQATPHLELLGYHTGTRRPVPAGQRGNAVAATRLVFSARDLDSVAPRPGRQVAILKSGRAAVRIDDPDRHVSIVLHREDIDAA